MAKKAERVPDDKRIERTVWMPGWAYNFVIEQAEKDRRDAKTMLSIILERAVAAEKDKEQPAPAT